MFMDVYIHNMCIFMRNNLVSVKNIHTPVAVFVCIHVRTYVHT